MKSLDIFKEYMSSSQVPNYVRRYCDNLDEFKWQWFYYQMKEPMEFVADTEYLFYVLKWILKYDFDDLGYEVYFQTIMDPEMWSEPLIKDKWWTILDKRYQERFHNDISEMHYDWNDSSVVQAVEDGIVVIL